MVEWYWQEKNESLGEHHLSVHLVQDNSHIDWYEIVHVPLRWETGNWPLEIWRVHSRLNVAELRLYSPYRAANTISFLLQEPVS